MKRHDKKSVKGKAAALLMVLCLAMVFGFAACGSGGKETGGGSAGKEQGSESQGKKETGYTFKANGVTMTADMDTAEILEDLGEPTSTFEEPSCAAQGTAYIYTYPGFQITTYPDGDKNLIGYVTLKDDTVSTPEGIDLSDSREDVIAAYGDDYTGDERQISYKKGDMTLNFIFNGDALASIEYTSKVMN